MERWYSADGGFDNLEHDGKAVGAVGEHRQPEPPAHRGDDSERPSGVSVGAPALGIRILSDLPSHSAIIRMPGFY